MMQKCAKFGGADTYKHLIIVVVIGMYIIKGSISIPCF